MNLKHPYWWAVCLIINPRRHFLLQDARLIDAFKTRNFTLNNKFNKPIFFLSDFKIDLIL